MTRLALAGVVFAALALSCCYRVDTAEFAYVTRFGQPVGVIDGGSDAGLHVKWSWPVETVRSIDRRAQLLEVPPVESLTRDAKNSTVDKTLIFEAFVTWRVPDAEAADRFVRAVGTPEQARQLLIPRLTSRLSSAVSNMAIDEIIRVPPADEPEAKRPMERLRAALFEAVAGQALADYGVEVVEVRIRRFSYPEAVRASIADRIRAERGRKVADYQSEGSRKAAEILALADREARGVEAMARADKERVEGEALAKADAIRAEAHGRDPEFYVFLQKLKGYQAMLAETRDVILLSTKHELFDLLLKPPVPGAKP